MWCDVTKTTYLELFFHYNIAATAQYGIHRDIYMTFYCFFILKVIEDFTVLFTLLMILLYYYFTYDFIVTHFTYDFPVLFILRMILLYSSFYLCFYRVVQFTYVLLYYSYYVLLYCGKST